MGWLLICAFMFLLSVCTSLDNLVPGESISTDQTLISSSGTFALGFFSPENSNKFFLASAVNPTTAVLMDSGNLQLKLGEDILWQSFDQPSDTLLPSVKLSLNKITGQQALLTSWAALDDPQPGMFSLGIDQKVFRGS
ncbi:hypothetical protein ACFX13_046334 [Malus domestica]